MLTCSTVRTKDSWQNDRSQGFRLCDRDELPCCDTCVKVPYPSHIRYSECRSTSAVPATHYCWVQMCLSMSYGFILQHYLRPIAPCCNPTNHLKQMPYRDVYNLQVLKPPKISVTSMREVLWSIKFHENHELTAESLFGKYTEYVKKEIWSTKVLFGGYPGGSSTKKNNSHLTSKKSSGSNSSYLKEAT